MTASRDKGSETRAVNVYEIRATNQVKDRGK